MSVGRFGYEWPYGAASSLLQHEMQHQDPDEYYTETGPDLDVAEYLAFVDQRISALESLRDSCDDEDVKAAASSELADLEGLREANEAHWSELL